jgi:pimeloyl-ACP methyl ester carboxylesterase
VAKILVIHGIGQQLKGPATLRAELAASLQDGLSAAHAMVSGDDIQFAFFGDLFRPSGTVLGNGIGRLANAELDTMLLTELWCRAAEVDSRVIPPDQESLGRSPDLVQRAIRALSRTRYFGGILPHLLVGSLRQVQRYFTDSALRGQVQERIAQNVSGETTVLVGHSLGTVVAYEAACANPDWGLRSLVTLGSPLGLRHVIFDRLRPAPTMTTDGQPIGQWPVAEGRWTNIVDVGDVVAAVEDLRPLFGSRIRHVRVHNGSRAHDMRPYLTEALTGEAIAFGLTDG